MDPNKPIPLEFEVKYDMKALVKWVEPHSNYAIVLIIFYLVAIWWGENYMRNKPPWNVRKLLIIWNSILAIFSFIGAARSWPSFFYIVQKYGWYDTVCIKDHYFTDPVHGFWLAAFSLSKTVELFDTAFLVVRKKPVTFLHSFHHATTAFVYWYFFSDAPSFARYFCCINFTVHAVMYAYYAVTLMKVIRLPRSVPMFITTFQIYQMSIFCFVSFYASVAKLRGIRCDVTPLGVVLGISFFPFYIYLFAKFFYGAYLKKTTLKRSTAINGTLSGNESEKKKT